MSDFPVANNFGDLFANGFNIGTSDPDPVIIAAKLNLDLKRVTKWAKNKRLKISAAKSQVTFFTPWNREKVFPPILYEGTPIPITHKLKSLGLWFDKDHTFSPNLTYSSSKGRDRVPIVKAVMGPTWGFRMEDGILTFKALISPVLGYGAPIFLPPRSQLKHPVAPLQNIKIACLRSITGCHTASSIQHLHECKMMQVLDHLNMQCTVSLEY
jgi:hypothetical protein